MKQQQRNMAQRLATAAAILVATALLSACGGSGGSGDSSGSPMIMGNTYQLGENSSLVATSSPPPEIEVVHDFDTNARRVTLLSGTAELYGDYVRVE